MLKELITFSIMPSQITSDTQISEIVTDVENQYKNGICTLAVFCMPIHPEREHVQDKAGYFCKSYQKIKKELDKRGLKSGVLFQTTIGHGAVKNKLPFQEYIKFTDGKGDGICCPIDADFQSYVYESVRKVALLKPNAILIDDDFRLITRGGKGCACPKHLARFNALIGQNLTREELYNIVTNENDSRCEEYTKAHIKVQFESLEETAKVIRSAIDSVDPSIQGVFCNGGDNGINIAKILAGKNNPTILRINNGYYAYNSTSGFTYSIFKGALQRSQYNGVDYIVAECDTCPHVIYAKTAKQLHAHYLGSILEGLNGAKHWITRLTNSQNIEWESGKSYRKILAKNSGLYKTASGLVDKITWHGFKIPLPKRFERKSMNGRVYQDANSFGEQCLERLGLPMYFSKDEGGITCFVDGNSNYFTSDELIKELSNNAIFSAQEAKLVANRGFEKYLGVKIEEYDGEIKPLGDKILTTGNGVQVQNDYKKLIPLNSDVRVTSELCYNDYETGLVSVGNGTTEYKNELGGLVTVFSGTPNSVDKSIYGYSFLNSSRKAQFIDILKASNEPLIYFKGEENVYLKTGTLKDGKNLTCAFNLCYDEIENFSLVYPTKPKKVSFVDCDGQIKELNFVYENGEIKTQISLNCLDVLLLIIE